MKNASAFFLPINAKGRNNKKKKEDSTSYKSTSIFSSIGRRVLGDEA